MLMKKLAKEAEKGPVGHSCCDICAKVCRCLFTFGDECTCEELCNSGNLQSPIADTHARRVEPENESIESSSHSDGDSDDSDTGRANYRHKRIRLWSS